MTNVIAMDLPVKRGNTDVASRPDGISYFHAFVSLFKAMVGAGVLSMPLAFKQSGLWCGAILIVILGLMTYYSYRKLVQCSQYLVKISDFHSLDYGEMTEQSFKVSFKPLRKYSTAARHCVNCSIFLLQVGCCAVYFDFVKEHLHEILLHIFGDKSPTKSTISLIVLAGFILQCQIRNIRSIAYVSLIGNVVMIAALAIIFPELVASDHVKEELPVIEDVGGIILAAGSIIYAFEGQAVILPMENKMKHPDQMMGIGGVLSVGCFVVTIVYVACGYFGYVAYGSEVKGSIALNLPDIPLFFYLKIMLTFVVFATYLVQMFVVVDMLWPKIEKRISDGPLAKHATATESVFRTVMALLTFAIATVVPDLENIIPLVGVTAGMSLALAIPPIVDTTTFLPGYIERKEYGNIAIYSTLNLLIFLAGLFFMSTGVVTNVRNIVNAHH